MTSSLITLVSGFSYILRRLSICFLLMIVLLQSAIGQMPSLPKTFVHPGLLQSKQDLDLLKKRVNGGEQPWKKAFENLVQKSNAEFKAKPFTHVIRGAYGSPAIGGTELSASANEAYSQALQWYITGEKSHAKNAIAIINDWSYRLWDFDDNDAKLLAGWTGHVFCNAAEILRYSSCDWQQKDIIQFKHMLMSVYYPLMDGFFPEANGNWDAALMDSMMSIAIFCDDHDLFKKVVDHYLWGGCNAGITKYIYPTGQCQESTRDQAHTQLGLGELALTCQTAWTQGVDLYGAADNRLALGFEYTSKYLLGQSVPAYGKISAKANDRFSDIYEGIYWHYHQLKGLNLPATKQMADTLRLRAGISVLNSVRAESRTGSSLQFNDIEVPFLLAGATTSQPIDRNGTFLYARPTDDLQLKIDSAVNGKTLILSSGLFRLSKTLLIPNGSTVIGRGPETVLFLDPAVQQTKAGYTLINANDDLHDVFLANFVIEGAMTPETSSDPNQDRRSRASGGASRAGIFFSAQREGQMKRIHLEKLTVRNCTRDGIAIYGADDIKTIDCDVSDNGSSAAPGAGLHHNVLLSHVRNAQIIHSRLSNSLWGNGLMLNQCVNVEIAGNEFSRNKKSGVEAAECFSVNLTQNLIEGNELTGVFLHRLLKECGTIQLKSNLFQNNQTAILLGKTTELEQANNKFSQNKIAGL